MKKISFLTVVGVFAFKILMAQNPSNDTTARYFLIQASISNLQEVASGKLALQRSSKPDVKAFAQMMITDHNQLQNKLLAVAKANNLQLPVAATDTPQPDNTLRKAAAQDFDRLYVHTMQPGHRETVFLYQNYSLVGKNTAVKAFAQQVLPMLKQHLSEIDNIEKNLKDKAAK